MQKFQETQYLSKIQTMKGNQKLEFTHIFKAFAFILSKLDLIHELLTTSNQKSFEHLYLIEKPREQRIFYEIQKVLEDIITRLEKVIKRKNPQNKPNSNVDDLTNLYKFIKILEKPNENGNSNNQSINNTKRTIVLNDQINEHPSLREKDLHINIQPPINEKPFNDTTTTQSQIYKLLEKTQDQDLVMISNDNNIVSKEITAMLELCQNAIIIGTKVGTVCGFTLNISSIPHFKLKYQQQIHSDRISFLCKLIDKKFITSSYDGYISVLNASTNGFIKEFFFKAHQEYVRKVIMINDRTFISCGNDCTIRNWNPYCENNNTLNFSLQEKSDVYSIIKLLKNPDHILITSCQDATLGFWNLKIRKKVYQLKNVYTFSPNGMLELPNGCFAVAHYDEPYSIKIVDPLRFAVISEITADKKIKVNASLCLRNQKSLCCVSDNNYCQISIENYTLECQHVCKGAKGKLGIVVVEKGKYLLIPNDSKGINIFSLETRVEEY